MSLQWESMNPFAFGENSDFILLYTIKMTFLAIIYIVQHWFPRKILVIIYFCLTPFSNLHLEEQKWYFGNVFLVPSWKFDVIIGHMVTKVGMAIKVHEIYSSPNLDNMLSKNKGYKTYFCFPPMP